MKNKLRNKFKNQEAITLVALVVTIVILLILAGVSLNLVLGNQGIISKAEQAKEKTERANIIEQARLDILEVQVVKGGSLTESELKAILEPKYGTISGEGEEQILTTKNGQEIKVSEIYTESLGAEPLANLVEVGDYIKYGEKLTATTYTTKTSETGYSSGTQTFGTNTNMLWRVISKKENGDIEIVAVSNVLANDGETGLYLCGETGFVNAEKVLKDLCDKLYTSSYGEARSIKLEDLNALIGFDPETSEWDESEKEYYLNNRSKTYTSGRFWDKASNIFKTATTENPVTVEHSWYIYSVENTMPLYDTLMQEAGTYNGDYSETNYPLFYWSGTRAAYVYDSQAYFIVNPIGIGRRYGWALVNTGTDGSISETGFAFGVRPIVNLKSDTKIEETTSTGGVTTWIIK